MGHVGDGVGTIRQVRPAHVPIVEDDGQKVPLQFRQLAEPELGGGRQPLDQKQWLARPVGLVVELDPVGLSLGHRFTS